MNEGFKNLCFLVDTACVCCDSKTMARVWQPRISKAYVSWFDAACLCCDSTTMARVWQPRVSELMFLGFTRHAYAATAKQWQACDKRDLETFLRCFTWRAYAAKVKQLHMCDEWVFGKKCFLVWQSMLTICSDSKTTPTGSVAQLFFCLTSAKCNEQVPRWHVLYKSLYCNSCFAFGSFGN